MSVHLTATNVTRRYGPTAVVEGVSLTLEPGNITALLGGSGAGKSTLLRLFAGLEPLDGGEIRLGDELLSAPGKTVPAEKRRIGLIFQDFALFPHLTVFENVAFGLRNGTKTVPEDEINSRVKEAVEMVGLAGLEDRATEQISGGQKQRVALARTLVMQPSLVLLDEPLGALDANLRDRMQTELRAIREKLDITFLHVTGSETEALAMGDTVAVLDSGKIIQAGTSSEIYDAPASPDVALFLNRFNLFDGTLRQGSFEGPFGAVAIPSARKSPRDVYAIRYDRVQVFAEGEAHPGPTLKARYLASEYLGSSVMYFFEATGGKIVEVEHHLSFGDPQDYKVGQNYILSWDPAHAIVFGQEGTQ